MRTGWEVAGAGVEGLVRRRGGDDGDDGGVGGGVGSHSHPTYLWSDSSLTGRKKDIALALAPDISPVGPHQAAPAHCTERSGWDRAPGN